MAWVVGPDHESAWVADAIRGARLAAPTLALFEAANIVRRHELAGLVTTAHAHRGHSRLLSLPIDQWPFGLLAGRAWELRHNLTVYDASYVALAELIGGTLVTLDRAIAAVPGVRCGITAPD